MTDERYGEKCDHDPCHCKTHPQSAVIVGKTVYCCAGCSEGRGCQHDECNCSEHEKTDSVH